MRKLFSIGLCLSFIGVSACSICSNKEVDAEKGKERGMLSEGKEKESNAQKRGFKSKHGVSSLIQQRLQEK